MEKVIDLHTHTNFSDGILTPKELLEKAVDLGISAIAITDHDTVDGYKAAKKTSENMPIELVVGCEFSCFENGKEYHLLGYEFDIENPILKNHLQHYHKFRLIRAKQIYNKLSQIGIEVEFDAILEKANGAAIARPHIAAVLVDHGYVNDMREAFNLYLGDGRPAYHPKANFPVAAAIEMINNAGGVAVLAHPADFVSQKDLYKMIQSGLDGIEVNHPIHNEEKKKYYHSIASQYWLLETGGSDFHGSRPYDEGNFGKFIVPYSVLESIRYHSFVK